jgi:hypothetical protein
MRWGGGDAGRKKGSVGVFYAGSVGGWLGMQDEWIREGVSVEVMEKRRKK